MTYPAEEKVGSLSIYCRNTFRKKWKACHCRLYKSSLFICYDGMVVQPKLSLHLSAVTPYIFVGRATSRIPGKHPKVKSGEERLLLAIPTDLAFPTDNVLWIKFLNDISMGEWLAAIIRTLPNEGKEKLCGMPEDFVLSNWNNVTSTANTASEASEMSSTEYALSKHPAHHHMSIHLSTSDEGILSSSFRASNVARIGAGLTAAAVFDRGSAFMHGRNNESLPDNAIRSRNLEYNDNPNVDLFNSEMIVPTVAVLGLANQCNTQEYDNNDGQYDILQNQLSESNALINECRESTYEGLDCINDDTCDICEHVVTDHCCEEGDNCIEANNDDGGGGEESGNVDN